MGKGGETTLRTRYNAWNADGVFERAGAEALAAYDRVADLDLTELRLSVNSLGTRRPTRTWCQPIYSGLRGL